MRLAFPLPLIPQRPPSALAAVPKPVDFGADAAKSTDLAIDGWGDAQGYHLDVGREKSGFAWQEAALISPEGVDDSSWIGYQCLSGDGRFAAVAVLPASVVNRQAARDHGALAYSVDLASGLVRPLATGVGLKYFSPGCGTGDEAVFSLDTGVNDQNTQLLSANLATGKIDAAITTSGQVTSAVPTASRIVGAAGPRLVSVSGNGKSVVVATESGDVYDLRPAADGGVNFLPRRPHAHDRGRAGGAGEPGGVVDSARPESRARRRRTTPGAGALRSPLARMGRRGNPVPGRPQQRRRVTFVVHRAAGVRARPTGGSTGRHAGSRVRGRPGHGPDRAARGVTRPAGGAQSMTTIRPPGRSSRPTCAR